MKTPRTQAPITAEFLLQMKFRSTSRAKWGETFVYEIDDRLHITVWIASDERKTEVMLVLVGSGARELSGITREKLTSLIGVLEPAV